MLGEYIEHHVKEEEGEMFPKARQAGLDLQSMAREIEARKDEIEFVPPRMAGLTSGLPQASAPGTR